MINIIYRKYVPSLQYSQSMWHHFDITEKVRSVIITTVMVFIRAIITLKWSLFCDSTEKSHRLLLYGESTGDVTIKSHFDSRVTVIWRLHCAVIRSVALRFNKYEVIWRWSGVDISRLYCEVTISEPLWQITKWLHLVSLGASYNTTTMVILQ